MKLHTNGLLPIAASIVACVLASASARAQFAQEAPVTGPHGVVRLEC